LVSLPPPPASAGRRHPGGDALTGLFRGENTGKLVVKVAEPLVAPPAPMATGADART
jgi:hypothetical protein